jgi:hypothetical protein
MKNRVQYLSVLSIVSLLLIGGFGTVFAANGEETPGPSSTCSQTITTQITNFTCDINETGTTFALPTVGDITGLGFTGVITLIICQQGTAPSDCPGTDISHWSDVLHVTVKFISATAFETDVFLGSDVDNAQIESGHEFFCEEVFDPGLGSNNACATAPVDLILAHSTFLGHAIEDANGCVCGFTFSTTANENVVLNIHSDREASTVFTTFTTLTLPSDTTSTTTIARSTTTEGAPEFGLPSVALAAIALFAFVLLALVKGRLYDARRV